MNGRKEKEPLLVNWNRVSRIPFELKFPQHTIPAESSEWAIKERIVDHPHLMLFYLENESWKNCIMSQYFYITMAFICCLPFFGLVLSIIFLLIVLQYLRFNTWGYVVILINPSNVSQWHGWIRLQEHGGFTNLDTIIEIIIADERASFNYQNATSLFEMDENILKEQWKKSDGSVAALIKKLGSLLLFESSSFDLDQMLREQDERRGENDIEIIDDKTIQNTIMKPNGHVPKKKLRVPSLTVQQSGNNSIALKEKYVSVMKEELEEREKLVSQVEDNEKIMNEMREKLNRFKSENRKLKLEKSKLNLVVEEKDDEIEKLKALVAEKKE